ncbi:MAG: acyltransferase family protein, partial [Sphaerospermopsis sp. SIO1G2]|nr:acyltransferase family protein [Sphaerospermopsis sp. SIO1G2]
FNIIYSFHLPLFLFLSGLFLNTEKPLIKLMLDKLDAIVKPYLITVFIGYVMFNLDTIDFAVFGMIYSTSFTLPIVWAPLWFLTFLWAVSVFSWLLIKLTKVASVGIVWQLILILVLLVIGFLMRGIFWKIPININGVPFELFGRPFILPGLPFSTDILFFGSFFFLLGFLCKSQVVSLKFQPIYFIFSLLIFGFCHYRYNYTIDLNFRKYDNLVISTVEAILGIYLVLSISSWLSKFNQIKNILAYIGTGSLFLLLFHYIVQREVYLFLQAHLRFKYLNLTLAFITGTSIPLLGWELVKRNKYLSLLFLPLKSQKSFAKNG